MRMSQEIKKLREAARETIPDCVPDEKDAAYRDIERVMLDLEVHQLELELQNEELMRTRDELKQTRDKYVNLYDFAPVGYLSLGENNLISDANLMASRLLGLDRKSLLGKPLGSFIDFAGTDTYYHYREEALATKVKQTCEVVMKRTDGTLYPARLEFIAVNSGELRLALFDITDQKQAEEALKARSEQLASANKELEVLVFERKKAEKVLRKSEHKYRALIETTGTGYVIFDVQGNILDANREYLKIVNYDTLEEIVGKNVIELTAEHDRERNSEEIKHCISQGLTRGLEIDCLTKDGRIVTMEVNATTIHEFDYIRIRALCRDISGRKLKESELRRNQNNLAKRVQQLTEELFKTNQLLQAEIAERQHIEKMLRETSQRLHLAITSGKIGIWDRDIASNKMIWNDEMYRIHGIAQESSTTFFETWQNCLHPDDYDRVMEMNKMAISGEQEYDLEFRILNSDQSVKWIKADAVVIRDAEGKPLRMIGINRDITKAKIMDLKLRASLMEKETLLKEIHHRVKNNLQVISSMLSMQARHVKNETALSILRESQNRIRAMSVVHSMLYKAENLTEINLTTYIHDIAKRLIKSYCMNHEHISLLLGKTKVMLPIETALPCSLIINELVSNSLKHAFPKNRTGEIKIDFHQNDDCIKMLFEDNGIGFPKEIDFRNTGTLGLEIIHLLIDQLDGTIELQSNGGTKYLITLQRALIPPLRREEKFECNIEQCRYL